MPPVNAFMQAVNPFMQAINAFIQAQVSLCRLGSQHVHAGCQRIHAGCQRVMQTASSGFVSTPFAHELDRSRSLTMVNILLYSIFHLSMISSTMSVSALLFITVRHSRANLAHVLESRDAPHTHLDVTCARAVERERT